MRIVHVLLGVLPLLALAQHPGNIPVPPTGGHPGGTPPAGARPPAAHSMLLVSPMFGVNTNRTEVVMGPPGTPPTVLTDTQPEYALFLMSASTRLVVNNVVFATSASGTDVVGDVLTANVYGPRPTGTTWNLGFSLVSHALTSAHGDMSVDEPLIKIGLVQRTARGRSSYSPYVGYGRERVSSGGPARTADLAVYGFLANYRAGRTQYSLRAYNQHDAAADITFATARLQVTALAQSGDGWFLRMEAMENRAGRDRSVLVGPVYAIN